MKLIKNTVKIDDLESVYLNKSIFKTINQNPEIKSFNNFKGKKIFPALNNENHLWSIISFHTDFSQFQLY